MRNPFIKGPSDTSYWGVDWRKQLDEGESIVTSSWVIVTPSTTLTVVTAYIEDGHAVVWLSGGSPGDRVTISNFITTDSQPVTRHLSEELLFWIQGPVAA